ncbi:MAG TPA: tagatose 1,6-diphosphate aldolase [Candidatus Acidoferrum sp.]|nr:tagatose 1,6-diphosphate aldolase [Candidatus Acidoferrum sp.]
MNSMPSLISAGKRKGLESVADSRGIIAALAIDQRSALRSLFSRSMGVDPSAVPSDHLSQFKEAVSSILTPHASAILLDPEFGLPAAASRSTNAGLLLAYEQTGYDKNVPGRLPRLLDGWSVNRLIKAGADAVKLLLYYSSRSSAEINAAKYAFVEKIGAECAAADVPFFLELVSYADNMDEKGIEFARIKHEIVAAGMKEFSNPQYRVDVLKIGMPVNLSFVEGSPSSTGEILYTREQAKRHFLLAAACSSIPFIYLSEGVSNSAFQFGLQLASEAGAGFSGVLCGRATWKDGVEIFVKQGPRALEDWLASEGVRNIAGVNQCLAAAIPWFDACKLAAPGREL